MLQRAFIVKCGLNRAEVSQTLQIGSNCISRLHRLLPKVLCDILTSIVCSSRINLQIQFKEINLANEHKEVPKGKWRRRVYHLIPCCHIPQTLIGCIIRWKTKIRWNGRYDLVPLKLKGQKSTKVTFLGICLLVRDYRL